VPVYDAFISYSHAKDKPIAAALQSVIQKLGKPWHKRRALRVFRDDTSLSATPQLWPSIEQALSQSRYLLLLASPEAAASLWVGREVEYWLTHKSPDTLLIGVTDGTLSWNEKKGDFNWKPKPPLPPALKGRFPAEPKWVDLSAYRDGADPRDTRFLELGADFAAAIHGTPKEDLLSQEVRQQKRAVRLAMSAAAIMLLLAIGAIAAGLVARYQADRAEKNFAAATDTVKGLIFDIAQGLRNVEGIRVESLDKILGQTRKAVERLTETDPDNAQLLYAKAAMLDQFAKTYLEAGNLDAALKNAEENLALLQHIGQTKGAGSGLMRQIVAALTSVGDIRRDRGDSAGALRSYELGLGISRDLPKIDEEASDFQSNLPDPLHYLTTNLERIAGLKSNAGDSQGALAAYQESIALMRRLAEQDKTNAEWQSGISTNLGNVCDLQRDIGEMQDALKSCDESLAISRLLSEQDQGNTEWQRAVSIGLERIGHLKSVTGKPEDALAAYEESLGVKRRLAALDAGNATWQRDVAIGYGRLGAVKQKLGDKQGALDALEEALAIWRALAKSDKDNVEWQQDIAIALDNVAYARVMVGDAPGAYAAYEENLAVARRVAAADPGNLRWQRSLAIALNRIGMTKLAAGDPEAALAAYEESLSISRRLADTDPDNITHPPDIAVALERIGHIKLNAGDRNGALAAYEESLAIARRMLEANPDSTVWQADLLANLDKVSELKLALGDEDGAIEAFEDGIAPARFLARVEGAATKAETDLVIRLYKLANVTDGERKQAALDEAIKIVERLDAEGKLAADQKDWKDRLLALREGSQAQ
jgi:tetratricopeptide (TPR) repeat protein